MNKFQHKLERLTEHLELSATITEPKEKILYIRMSEESIQDVEEMQKYFKFTKRSDFVRALIEDAIKTFKKAKIEDKK